MTLVESSSLSSTSSSSSTSTSASPPSVGILALEVYTPRTFIRQTALEAYLGVPAGKYTIGLGQEGLAVTGDAEDINSICLTAVQGLLEKYQIDPASVGRLEVGTETLIDKSKSTKTVLMDLFPGNSDMEGATVVNACYGGTAALLNAFVWCESAGWDGRYAIVVAADIATYAAGPARPTCGAGAVAILVGRDAPLAFVPQLRATHAAHVWDFFKPNPAVEYPTVDGALSQQCYYQALEDVYARFVPKMEAYLGKDGATFDATTPDYCVFHSPYNKLVQKSYARLFLLDARRQYQQQQQQCKTKSDDETATTNGSTNGSSITKPEEAEEKKDFSPGEASSATPLEPGPLHAWLDKELVDTYNDKELEAVLKQVSAKSYKAKMTDSNAASIAVGNTYTASIFLGLASLIDRAGARKDLKDGQWIMMFSYGSGALATMYALQVRTPTTQDRFTIERMAQTLQLTARLEQREEIDPAELDRALDTRARMHSHGAPYQPVYPTVGRMFPGTYYLTNMDSQWRRTYARVPLDAPVMTGIPLAPPSVLLLQQEAAAAAAAQKSQTKVELEKPTVECYITGTAAGLPGGGHVFQSNNMERLLHGEQLIKPISDKVKHAMLEKNIVQLERLPDKSTKSVPLDQPSDMIQLAAQLGSFCMTESYGVPDNLAQTMDVAAQVAVAAGLEALKNAGLVSGRSNDSSEWMLPEEYRDQTGVVYASSFPAMDAAIGEVMRFLSSQTIGAADSMRLICALRQRWLDASSEKRLPDEDEAAFAQLMLRASTCETKPTTYSFDRKFLFRVLVLGNAQLAQLAGCRGPNAQTNAACAGTTQAIAMAQDMLTAGRAARVVVIAGDNASGETLMPWLGSGFRVMGAATSAARVEEAALPFDKRRSGMLMGAGAIGLVLETVASVQERMLRSSLSSASSAAALHPVQVQARLLATQYSNSAYHGAALDRKHISSELVRFLQSIEDMYGITKQEIAQHGVYLSHETCTHASDATSCAGNEVAALRHAFGDELLAKLLIVNTKGFTGHPMGVSFEDVTAVAMLQQQYAPAVPNHQVCDEYLGPLNLSKGGPYPCRYALRFAAGFGSQVAFALYAKADDATTHHKAT